MVAYTKPQQREKEESEKPRGERDQIKFMACCRTQESKRKARRSINCMFLGWMMICEIEFVE